MCIRTNLGFMLERFSTFSIGRLSYHRSNMVRSRGHTAGSNVIFLIRVFLLPLASAGSFLSCFIVFMLAALRATDSSCEALCIRGSSTLNVFMCVIGLGSESLFFLSLLSCYAILMLNSSMTSTLVSRGAASGIGYIVLTYVGLALAKYTVNVGHSDHFSFALVVLRMTLFLARHMRDHAGSELYVNTNIRAARRVRFTSIHATHVFICALRCLRYLRGAHITGHTVALFFVVRYFHLVEVLWTLISSVVLTSLCSRCFSFSVLNTVSHKYIGSLYWTLAVAGCLLSFLNSRLIRFELVAPGRRLIAAYEAYSNAVTTHGVIRIFGFVMPRVFSAFGNRYIPLLNAAPEVGYARLNNSSLVIYTSTLVIIARVYGCEFRIGLGWTFYPPLSTTAVLVASYGVMLLVMALNIRGISSTLTSINFLATTLVRPVSYRIVRLGAYIRALATTSLLLVLVLPAFGVALVLLLSDATINTGFYDASFGGDILLYRHLFWVFGHPEVYVLILPSFGIASLVFTYLGGIGVIGERVRVLGVLSIAALGLVVWAHHRFTTGMELDTRVYFSALTRVIAVPTGCKIYNYLLTMGTAPTARLYSNVVLYLLLYVFVVLFTFGGATGVILGNSGVDIVLHDTYYVVAHFHYVLSLGSSIAIGMGTLIMCDTVLGISGFHHTVTALNLVVVLLRSLVITFFARHRLGFNTRPRRYVDYADNLAVWNCLCTFGTVHLLLSVPMLLATAYALDHFFLSSALNTHTRIMSTAINHVIEYHVPAAINYAWAFGFILTMLLVARIVSGFFLVSTSIHSGGVAGLLLEVKRAYYGWMLWRIHSIGSSFLRGGISVHTSRAIIYGSAVRVANIAVWTYGVLIYVLRVVSCFLGYSTCYGLRAHWALRVVRGLVAWLPRLDIWFYGSYTPNYYAISKCRIFHVLAALVTSFCVILHLFLLHSTSSSRRSSYTAINLRSHVLLKDVIAYSLFRIVFAVYARGVASVINSDNAIIVDLDNLARISHIVPEWYLCTIYRLIKLVPSAHLGLMLAVNSVGTAAISHLDYALDTIVHIGERAYAAIALLLNRLIACLGALLP